MLIDTSMQSFWTTHYSIHFYSC